MVRQHALNTRYVLIDTGNHTRYCMIMVASANDIICLYDALDKSFSCTKSKYALNSSLWLSRKVLPILIGNCLYKKCIHRGSLKYTKYAQTFTANL